MFWSIAPTQITLADGTTIDFRVNASDSSICEIHVTGRDGQVTVKNFKRNGASSGPDEYFAVDAPTGERRPVVLNDSRDPLSGFRSVNDDAVRGSARDAQGNLVRSGNPQTSRTFGDLDNNTKIAGQPFNPNDPNRSATGEAKTSPVHGKINTVGVDNFPSHPPEGKPPLDPQRVG